MYLVLFTWSFIVGISLSVSSLSRVVPVFKNDGVPITSNKKCCSKPPSEPGKHITSSIVSLCNSHERSDSGASIYTSKYRNLF